MGVLDGKVVVVTGAAHGLGRAYAIEAAASGASVVVNDIDGEAACRVVAEIEAVGGRARVSEHSVSDWAGAHAIVGTAIEHFGAIDGLVNNAGVLLQCLPWDLDESGARRVVETNLLGTVFVGTEAMKVMRDQGSGSIVNITSTAQLGLPFLAVYGATKGAIASLTYSWSMDLAASNVRVNAYSPTAMTSMTTNSLLKPGDVPTAEANAGAVVYLLSDLSKGITGQVVQRRRNHLAVVAHPRLTDSVAVCSGWTAEVIAQEFDPILRQNLEDVGWDVTRP